MRRTLAVTLTIALVLFAAAGLAACTADSAEDTAPTTPATSGDTDTGEGSEEAAPPAAEETDPDVALVENKCSLCHTTERVWSADYDKATWAATIDRMKSNGLVISDEDYATIVDYLSAQ